MVLGGREERHRQSKSHRFPWLRHPPKQRPLATEARRESDQRCPTVLSSTWPGLPTCLVCVCLGSSVYCDDANLENIPPLPQMTTYLYARFNHISHIQAGDFKGMSELRFKTRWWQGREDCQGTDVSSQPSKGQRLLSFQILSFKILKWPE